MKTLLEDFGFELDIAANGKIAIEKLKEQKFDLILMDLQMPEMNGFDATVHIRKKMKLDVPIIALTADVTTMDLEKCKAIGMDDYISKPIDDKLLLKKLNKFLKEDVNDNQNNVIMKEKTMSPEKVQKCTNLDFLRQLTKNNPEMIAEMIQVYLEETPQLLKAMKQSLQNQDWEKLRAAAHSIIPSFSTMGMSEEYAELAKAIQEQAEKKEDPEKIKLMLQKIGRVCEEAYAELKQELSVLKEM
jgi:CheY-like chemotaxis protein